MNARERVIALQEDLCVTAGAGAGKTTCLVDAYIGLLRGNKDREPLSPKNVLAITFTEKAAAEMLSRIVGQVQAMADQGQQTARWSGILPELEWAPISTIHSFCTELLRESGAVLGIDPDFGVIDAEDFEALKLEIAIQLLQKRLEEQNQLVARLLVHFNLDGPYGLSVVLSSLVQQLFTLGVDADQARRLSAAAHDAEQSKHGDLVRQIDDEVAVLAGGIVSNKFNKNAGYYKKLNKLVEDWQALKTGLETFPPTAQALDQMDFLVKGGWGKAKASRDVIQPAVKDLHALSHLAAAALCTDDLLVLADQLSQAIEQDMARQGVISFDHLLLFGVRLLEEHPLVLRSLQDRFHAIMVDEFQDVNPVQGRLIRLMAGLDDAQPKTNSGPLLLLVGDRKQSIYAFRGAEVSQFAEYMESFQRKERLVALAENFRSAHGMVEFFNRLFEKVFGPSPPSVQPESFKVTFRVDDSQKPSAPDPGKLDQPVEVLDCRTLANDDDPAALWRTLEANALANHLNNLIKTDEEPGGIVLLFRRMTQVGVYEDALRSQGVDFYTVRGSGFFECQEIIDLAMGLRAVMDPGDSRALLGLLRSPLIGLGDDALFALTRPNVDEFRSLSDALAQQAPLPQWLGADQKTSWQRALELINSLAPLARRMGPAELIQRLVQATDLEAILAAAHNGEQKMANLRKLIEMARDPHGRLGQGSAGFAYGLLEMVENPPLDPQAPLAGEEAPVVRLMSIHQAKGLEFPTVVLPDLDWQPKAPSQPILVGEHGVAAAKPIDPNTGELVASGVYKQIQKRGKEREHAEIARLFYVACTRAEERLIFCLTGSKKHGPWAKWVQEYLANDPAVKWVPPTAQQGRVDEAITPVREWPSLLPPDPGLEADRGAAVVNRIMSHGHIGQQRFVESVTGLGNWLKCPRLYFWVRRMGLDTANYINIGTNLQSSQGGGVELGTLVHSALELADLREGPEAGVKGLEKASNGNNIDSNLLKNAQNRVTAFWETELADLIANNPKLKIMKELSFRVHLDGASNGPAIQLIGNIDLLLQWDNGEQLLVDYKVTEKIDIEPYVYQLGLYAMALSRKKTGVQKPPRTAILFLTKHGPHLQYKDFTPKQLDDWEQQVRDAACEITSWPDDLTPAQIDPNPNCHAGNCPLKPICRPENQSS